jgi:hypothetical protein
MTKLRRFLAGKTCTAFSLLRAIRLREAPCLLLGFIVMLLTSPEKDCRNRLNITNTQGDAMLQNNTDEKAEIYDTLSSMNRAFVGIVQSLQTLQKKGLFQSKAAKLFPSFAQELQAEFNQEFLEALA